MTVQDSASLSLPSRSPRTSPLDSPPGAWAPDDRSRASRSLGSVLGVPLTLAGLAAVQLLVMSLDRSAGPSTLTYFLALALALVIDVAGIAGHVLAAARRGPPAAPVGPAGERDHDARPGRRA